MNEQPWHEEEDADGPGYELVWQFINRSPDFVLGIEAGVISERMHRKEQLIVAVVHGDNEEELRNLANTSGYSAAAEELSEGWLTMTFIR